MFGNVARDCRKGAEHNNPNSKSSGWSGTHNQRQGQKRGKTGQIGLHEIEEHDRGTTESQNPAKITQSGRTQIAGQSENWDGSGWWTGDCCAHAWEDTTWDPPTPHPMPSPSVQSQATSTQRGGIQMLGGLMCELSGCNERRQGDQNEMTKCQKHWPKN